LGLLKKRDETIASEGKTGLARKLA
jgi:hypothetical protein